MLDQEYVNKTAQALGEACPLAHNSAEAVEVLKSKVLRYHDELGIAPPETLVIAWAVPLEQALQQKIDDAESEVRRAREEKETRKQRFRDSNSPAAYDRAAMLEDMRQRNPTRERPVLAANTNFTDAEMDKMSGDEYKRLVLNVESTPLEELNVSQPDPERQKLLETIALRKPKKDTPLTKALRRTVREGLTK